MGREWRRGPCTVEAILGTATESARMPPDPPEQPDPDLWRQLGWRPDRTQLDRLRQLQDLLRQWNERLNLTRLVEGEDYWIAQVFDSLWPHLDLLAGGGEVEGRPLRLIDVGSGGGFPGLAVAIALPHAHLTLVDSVGRKVEAVRAMAAELGLAQRLEVRAERIERTGRSPDCRARFDRAMARAVARPPVVAEYLVPLLRADGLALLYRGLWSGDDERELRHAAARLAAEVVRIERRDLPRQRGVRHAVWLRPLAPCPAAFPRPVGVPQRSPLLPLAGRR
jgi:16S rRNA (guanine527-N7)-methyltransferase